MTIRSVRFASCFHLSSISNRISISCHRGPVNRSSLSTFSQRLKRLVPEQHLRARFLLPPLPPFAPSQPSTTWTVRTTLTTAGRSCSCTTFTSTAPHPPALSSLMLSFLVEAVLFLALHQCLLLVLANSNGLPLGPEAPFSGSSPPRTFWCAFPWSRSHL